MIDFPGDFPPQVTFTPQVTHPQGPRLGQSTASIATASCLSGPRTNTIPRWFSHPGILILNVCLHCTLHHYFICAKSISLRADPTDLTVWEWAFEDKRYSPVVQRPPNQIAGFTNATTGERLDYLQIKEHSTHLCTALVNNCGLQEADTVSLFSPNTIWYPVAMFAVLRAGMSTMRWVLRF